MFPHLNKETRSIASFPNLQTHLFLLLRSNRLIKNSAKAQQTLLDRVNLINAKKMALLMLHEMLTDFENTVHQN